MDTFSESQNDRHPTELAALQGARLVIASETEQGRNWNESRIKALTAGDAISARFMRRDFFEFTPCFKLLIAGNHRPRLRAVDAAIQSRFHMVPFEVIIPPGRRDPDLPEKLRSEWPGILGWAIAGCLDYLDSGLRPPAAVRSATETYFDAQNLFGDWLAEHCELGADYWEPPARLFYSWCQFAKAANERPGQRTEFRDRLDKFDDSLKDMMHYARKRREW